MKVLAILNSQREFPVNRALLRRMTRHLLEAELGLSAYEIGVHLVGPTEMARINETFLNHTGPTDVITFAHAEPPALHGELFICPAVAREQARKFRTTWPAELARYVVHGILHLQGHDDLDRDSRRAMKRIENRLVTRLAAIFPPRRITATPAEKR